MNVVLFDLPEARIALRPFTLVRPIAQLRLGIATLAEKWSWYLPGSYTAWPCGTLRPNCLHATTQDVFCVNATLCPNPVLAEAVAKLQPHEKLLSETGVPIAFRLEAGTTLQNLDEAATSPSKKPVYFCGEITQLKNVWDLFLLNATEIEKDWQWYAKGRVSKPVLDDHTVLYNEKKIFIEAGVSIKAAVLNAEEGPIYIGKHTSIAEGSVLKGPLAVGADVRIGIQSSLFEGTTVGPHSTIRGSVGRSVLGGYNDLDVQSSLYGSVLGSFCTVAGGVRCSTRHPHAASIPVWDFDQESHAATHLPVCGSFVGDYSRIGPNVHLDAGTVIGIASYVQGPRAAAPYVPSFVHQHADARSIDIPLEEAMREIQRTMQEKQQQLSQEQMDLLADAFAKTALHRIKARM